MNQNFEITKQSTRTIEYTSSSNMISSAPIIETTHYSTNQVIPGTVQTFQTVSFDGGVRRQSSIEYNGYKPCFRFIPENEQVQLRETICCALEGRFSYPVHIQLNQKHEENLVYSFKDGKPYFIETLDNIDVEERRENYEKKGYRMENYVGVLKEKKDVIINLKTSNFQVESSCENMWQNLRNLILNSAQKALDYSINFKENYMSFLGLSSLSMTDIQNMRVLVDKILDSHNNLDFRGIGLKPELKQQYIALAIFLITYEKKDFFQLNFYEMEKSLRYFIGEIYQLRQETVNCYTDWLQQLITHYHTICQAGNIQIDTTWLNSLQIDMFSGRVEIRESGEYMEKYNQLLIKYNTEIKSMEQTIYNLRSSVNSANMQVQEVKNN